MTQIYIHIGTHKTGTTTIQQGLLDLAKKNPEQGLFLMPDNALMIPFARATAFDKAAASHFRKELENIITRNPSKTPIVLSNENLSGSSVIGYQNCPFAFAMLRRATEAFKVKIIIYLRRQDSFVESLYTQFIHEGHTREFKDFLDNYKSPAALDYFFMIKELSTCFGQENIIVKSFHDAARRGLLADFGDTIALEALKQIPPGRSNPSYSCHAVEIAKICNAALDKGKRKKAKKTRLRLALQKTMAKPPHQSFSFFTEAERVEFMKKYRSGNQALADRYFNGDLDLVFPAPSLPGLQQDGLTYDGVAQLVLHLLKEQDNEILKNIKADRCQRRMP